MSAPHQTMLESPRVAGLGIACLDSLFLADRVRPGSQGELLEHATQGGGLVATALVAAARLGASPEIITWVGDDSEGDRVLSWLASEHVDVSRASAVAGARTPVSVIHVEPSTGERTIYHQRALSVSGEAAERVVGDLGGVRAAVVDAVWPEASLVFARRARTAGVPLVADFCPDEESLELAGMVDALIVPRACAERLGSGAPWREALQALSRLGPGFVAVTAGAEGCYYLEGDRVSHQPAFPVRVVDTTGAGDVFHGAFAYGLARGWDHPRCVQLAAAAAALSCRGLGGPSAIPSLDEALALAATAPPPSYPA